MAGEGALREIMALATKQLPRRLGRGVDLQDFPPRLLGPCSGQVWKLSLER